MLKLVENFKASMYKTFQRFVINYIKISKLFIDFNGTIYLQIIFLQLMQNINLNQFILSKFKISI